VLPKQTHERWTTVKWTTLLLVIALACNQTGSALQTLEPNAEPLVPTPELTRVARIKAEITRRGVGEKSRVRVKLRNKLQFKGHITQIEEDQFELQIEPDWLDADTSKDRLVEIHYADVAKIRGPQSRTAKIGTGIGLTVAAIAVVAAIITLEVLKYNREHR
jgi:hypothetical protein